MKKKVQVLISTGEASKDRKWLLLQTNSQRGEFWQNVTGSVDKDESFSAAASRELQEETGFDPNPPAQLIDLNLTIEFEDRKNRKVKEQVFLFNLNGEPMDPQLDSKEHQNFNWIPENEINSTHFGFRSNYECFLKAKEIYE